MNPIRGCFVAALASLLLGPVATAEACTLKAGWEPWPPYQFKEKGKETGIDIEIFELVAAEVGCTVIWEQLVWKRILLRVEKGRADVALSASVTADRQKWGRFTKAPYRSETMSLFVLKDELPKHDYQSAAALIKDPEFRLGVTLDYHYGESITNHAKTKPTPNNLMISNKPTKHYERLIPQKKGDKRRIDGFVGDKYATIDALKQRGLHSKVVLHPMPVNDGPIHFLFSKASVSQATVDAFDRAIAKRKTDIQKILDKYSR